MDDDLNDRLVKLTCDRCGGLPPGEASGAGDLCICRLERKAAELTAREEHHKKMQDERDQPQRPYELGDLPALADEAELKDYRIIMNMIVPQLLAQFLERSKDYGRAFELLGAKGQFSDINRKFWKLHRAIWLGQPLTREGEGPEECAEDIIGHCLLLIYILRYLPDPEKEAQLAELRRTVEQVKRAALHVDLGDSSPPEDERPGDGSPDHPDFMPLGHHETGSGAPDRPGLPEVLSAIRRAARGESRDGTAMSRIEDTVAALFARGEQIGHLPTQEKIRQAVREAMFVDLMGEGGIRTAVEAAYSRASVALDELYNERGLS